MCDVAQGRRTAGTSWCFMNVLTLHDGGRSKQDYCTMSYQIVSGQLNLSVSISLVIHLFIICSDLRLISYKTEAQENFLKMFKCLKTLCVGRIASRKVVAESDFYLEKKFQYSGRSSELWETEGCYQWLSSDKSWELHPCQHSSNKPLMIELWWLSIYSAQPVHALFPNSERLWSIEKHLISKSQFLRSSSKWHFYTQLLCVFCLIKMFCFKRQIEFNWIKIPFKSCCISLWLD